MREGKEGAGPALYYLLPTITARPGCTVKDRQRFGKGTVRAETVSTLPYFRGLPAPREARFSSLPVVVGLGTNDVGAENRKEGHVPTRRTIFCETSLLIPRAERTGMAKRAVLKAQKQIGGGSPCSKCVLQTHGCRVQPGLLARQLFLASSISPLASSPSYSCPPMALGRSASTLDSAIRAVSSS